jgi:hypothetical protein
LRRTEESSIGGSQVIFHCNRQTGKVVKFFAGCTPTVDIGSGRQSSLWANV